MWLAISLGTVTVGSRERESESDLSSKFFLLCIHKKEQRAERDVWLVGYRREQREGEQREDGTGLGKDVPWVQREGERERGKEQRNRAESCGL